MAKPLTTNVRTEASGDFGLGPIELYDIFLDNITLHLVRYDKSISFFGPTGDAVTYIPFPITRESKRSTSDMAIDNVVIRAQNIDLGMSAYIASGDFRGRRAVVRKIFPQYTASSGDAALVIDGYIENIAVDQHTLQAEIVPKAIGTLRAEGPRRWYQVLCNWKFADVGTDAEGRCATNSDNSRTLLQATAGTVGNASTVTRIVDTARTEGGGKTGNGVWVDGTFELTSGTLKGTRRKVITSRSGSFDLDFNLNSIPSGDSYVIKRGCDKTLYRCSGDHANQAQFGGFSTIPQQEIIR